ncbi:MAG: OmpA family protein [Polyangiaceae bacterium]
MAGIAAAALTVAPREASAQEQIELPVYSPSFAGDRFFGVPSAYTPSGGIFNFHGGIFVDYAHNPLVLASDDGSNLSCGEPECSVVEHSLFLHLNATAVFVDRFSINVDMPFALFQSGEGDVSGGGNILVSPDGPAIGDLRVGARVRLYGDYFDPFQIAIGGYLWVPTGTEDAYVTDGSVRGQPQVIVGGRADRFIYSVMVGPKFRAHTEVAGTTSGYQFGWGAGLGGLLLDDRSLMIGVESTGAVTFEDTGLRNTNAEAEAVAKLRFASFLEAGVAVGPGFTTGLGTPDVRALFTFQYTPEMKQDLDSDGDGILDSVDACPQEKGEPNDDPKKNGCPKRDRDKDGIFDDDDACPDEPGEKNDDPKKNGCPKRDRDKDGIFDDDDACPDVAGVADPDPKKNGCPPPPKDTDGDGIIDDEDACVTVAGVKDPDPKKNGCPPDRDGDGIIDSEDACPDVPGVKDPDPTKNGCPPKAIFTETEIVILEQVQFDTGKATIKSVSDPLLDAVGKILKDHPEVLKVEVQGHTDNRGGVAYNKQLSDARAKAVVEALVKRGVDKKRLVAKGYGQSKPLDPENNEQAWQKNRRVQFIVLEKAPSSTAVQTK